MASRVTQESVEALYLQANAARVTQEAVEVLYSGEQRPVGAQVFPNPPIRATRLPDYSWVGPYFMRDANVRVTHEPLEVVNTGDSNALVTQAGIELVIPSNTFQPQGMGVQVTPDPIRAKRLPDYSFIEPYYMRDAIVRITQAGMEFVQVVDPNLQITQAGIEFVLKFAPVGKQLTAPPYEPFPGKKFPYSWEYRTPFPLITVPPQFPIGQPAYELPPTAPSTHRDYSYTQLGSSFALLSTPPQFPVGVSSYELPPTAPNTHRDYSFVGPIPFPLYAPTYIPPSVGPEDFRVIFIF